MKAVFCHDGRYLVEGDGRVHSAAHFGSRSWDRYLAEFDELDVVGRGVEDSGNEPATMVRSDAPGVSFHTLPNLNSPGKFLSNRPRARKRLAPLIESADALILRGVTGLGSVAFSVARELGRPIAVEMSGCPFDNAWYYGTTTGRLVAPFRFLVGRRICASADFVIYVSREFLQRRYPARGQQCVASNVEIDEPSPDILRNRIERIRVRDGEFVLGLIGKVDHHLKGIHTALEALAGEGDRLPPFTFRVLGDGSPDRWRTLAERLGLGDRVFFDGTLKPGDEVHRWLDGIDLYLQPSFHEGVPRATIEAMSRGCPVIGSTAGGIPELVETEWLHKPGDARSLGRLVSRMAGSLELQAACATTNVERSREYSSAVLRPRRESFWNSFARMARDRRTERS